MADSNIKKSIGSKKPIVDDTDNRDIFEKALDANHNPNTVVGGMGGMLGGMLVGGLAGKAYGKAKKAMRRPVSGDEGFIGSAAGGLAGEVAGGYAGSKYPGSYNNGRKSRRK